MKFSEKINKGLGAAQRAAAFMDVEPHFSSLKNGILVTVPATIIGGFMTIFLNPPVTAGMEGTNVLFRFLLAWKEWSVGHGHIFNTVNNMTMGLIALYAAIGIAYFLAKWRKIDILSAVITVVMTFLLVASPAEAVSDLGTYMSTGYLGGKGLFTAIIVSLLSVDITAFLIKKNIKIKMPDSVPPAITAPFEALIPMLVNIALFFGGSLILKTVTGYTFPELVIRIFQPLVASVDSLPGLLLMVTLMNFLWIFGINGGAVVNGVANAFTFAAVTTNAAALTAGTAMPFINAGSFYCIYGNIGGGGATLSLVVLMFFLAKSSQLKAVSKVGIIPQLFNINEPVVYGIPMIMNPFMMVPMLFIPIVNAVIGYTLTSLDVIGRVFVAAPWSLPGPVMAFCATMDWKAVVVWFGLVVLDMLLYYPFFKAYDNYLQKQETELTGE